MKATSGMPARAAASATGRERGSRRAIETAIPSAFFEIADRSALHASPTLTRAGSRSTASCSARAQPRPARRTAWRRAAGRASSWLTKTNRQRGCAGKSPPPSPASAAAGPSSWASEKPAAPAPARRRKFDAGRSCPVLQQDPADDASRSPISANASSNRSAGKRLGHDRAEVDEPGPEQLDHARPDGRRVADAADQLEVAKDEAVGGKRSARGRRRRSRARRSRPPSRGSRVASSIAATAPAVSTTRSSSPSWAAVPGRRRRPSRRAEPPRQLELGLADPVGDDRRRRKQPRKHERERSERADADHADRLSRPRLRALEPLEDDRRRLDQHGRVERDAVRQRVDDAPRRDHELAVAAAAGEAELVVASRRGWSRRPGSGGRRRSSRTPRRRRGRRARGRSRPRRPPRRRRSTRGPGCTGNAPSGGRARPPAPRRRCGRARRTGCAPARPPARRSGSRPPR